MTHDTEPTSMAPDGTGRLVGRRILITGGADGIGGESAEWCLRAGAAVAVLDVREARLAAQASRLAAKYGVPVPAVHCDVADEDSVREAVRQGAESLGGIDGLVTSAGLAARSGIEGTSLQSWEHILRVNLTGSFLTVRESLPWLLANPSSSVVTIGSAAALVAVSSSAAYAASKGGVLMLTRSLALEYGERGLRANCVCPGPVATKIWDNSAALRGVTPGDRTNESAFLNPLHRGAVPAEIAGVVGFLLSDESSFMTGAAVPVDGGLTAV